MAPTDIVLLADIDPSSAQLPAFVAAQLFVFISAQVLGSVSAQGPRAQPAQHHSSGDGGPGEHHSSSGVRGPGVMLHQFSEPLLSELDVPSDWGSQSAAWQTLIVFD